MRFALVLGLLCVPLAAQESIYKHVSAPPADFELLRLPTVEETGVRSRGALVPVYVVDDGAGAFAARLRLPIDGGDAVVAILPPRPGTWETRIGTKRGTRKLADVERLDGARVVRRHGSLSLGGPVLEVEGFVIENARAGMLDLVIAATEDWNPGERADGFVAIVGREDLVLETRLAHHELSTGRELGFTARMEGAPAWIETATLVLLGPDGAENALPMADDGQGAVEVSFHAVRPGRYVGRVDVRGFALDGAPFRRTTRTLFEVVDVRAGLVGARAEVDGDRLRLLVDAELEGERRVQIGAEVWIVDGSTKTPVAWIGRIAEMDATSGRGELPIELDAAWFERAGRVGAIELRNVRLQHVDTHAVLARAARIEVTGEAPPQAWGMAATPVDSGLLAPPELAPAKLGLGALREPDPLERGLMLVHGYCSGGVWPTADFTDYAIFEDFDKSRSHDTFALLLRQQASTVFDSFGVVAHSQGGAAALHLLTFYNSGLDRAKGARLIQSVGTPYQGTPIADLADLGSVLGVGCGENTDLTTTGSLMWLANIPSAERSRVHYYTTSYSSPTFFNNCNFAASLVLSAPEDGTTERARGALPGGNGQGNTLGWCHTIGMSEPAHYTDHTRNATMNSTAAR